MSSFCREDKERMRQAQFNRCGICGKQLGEDAEGHAINRNHGHWLLGMLVCPECHRETKTYGRRRPDPRDPFGI